jgi:type IV secretory pathway protease TraF
MRLGEWFDGLKGVMAALGVRPDARLVELRRSYEREVLSAAPAFREMVATVGWAQLEASIDGIVRSSLEEMVGDRAWAIQETPPDIAVRNAEREWLSGYVSGLRAALAVPGETIEAAQQIAAERKRRGESKDPADQEEAT